MSKADKALNVSVPEAVARRLIDLAGIPQDVEGRWVSPDEPRARASGTGQALEWALSALAEPGARRTRLGLGEMLDVRAGLVGPLRSGLYLELGIAGGAIASITERPGHDEHPEWYSEHRERFDRTRAALDEIGWASSGAESRIEVDLSVHGEAVKSALQRTLEIEQYVLRDRITKTRGGSRARIALVRALGELLARVDAEAGTSADITEKEPCREP